MTLEICGTCGAILPGDTDGACTSCTTLATLASGQRVRSRIPRSAPGSAAAVRTAAVATHAVHATDLALRAGGPAASLLGSVPGEGVVLQMAGPHLIEGRRDGWRAASLMLLFVLLLPIALGVWAVLFALRLVLSIVGLRSGGGQGLFSEIIAFHLFGNAARRPDPIPVYDYVLQTGTGLQQARQEGEFAEGRIFVGNRVRLDGRLRSGVLMIDGGENLTLGTSLTRPVSPWRAVFTLLALVACGAAVAALTWAPPLGFVR